MDAFVLKDSVTGNMSDAEFFKFCMENPQLRIERNSNLEIIIMSPVSSKSSLYSSGVHAQLFHWNSPAMHGVVFDSSAGFTLRDRSVLSPDASWLSKDKWNRLSEEDQNRFAPVCPEFVIEVRSKSDYLLVLKKKMKIWLSNGAQLAWLIDPIEKMTYVYRTDGSEETIQGFDKKITGEAPVKDFELDLSLLET
jgi:Uma2 family endonuclease